VKTPPKRKEARIRMTKCPKCGATMYRVGKDEDKIILECSKDPDHILKKKITPRQQLKDLCRMMAETPQQAQKRSLRYKRRRNKEKE